jgi:hypothetical protein
MGLSQVVNNMFIAQDASYAASTSKATRPSILAKGLFQGFKDTKSIYEEMKGYNTADVGIDTFSKRGVNK